MQIVQVILLILLSSTDSVSAQRKQRQKNQFGIEPENLEQIKSQLIVETNNHEPEEQLHTYAEHKPDQNFAWEDGKLVHENDNWHPMGFPTNNGYYQFPVSTRITMKNEKKGISETSRWMNRPNRMQRWDKLSKFRHAQMFKPQMEDPVIRLEEPCKQMSSLHFGSSDLQEMVHVNSTYVKDAYYDKLFKVRSQKLSKENFFQMVRDLYEQTYIDYLEELKNQNSYMNYPFRKFLELETTKNLQWRFVKDHQQFWWDWFDQDHVVTLFIDGSFFNVDKNNVTMAPQEVLIKEFYEDQVFEIGASDFITEEGYISKSWLWFRLQAIELPYLQAVETEIMQSYLKTEIPLRVKEKMYGHFKKGPSALLGY